MSTARAAASGVRWTAIAEAASSGLLFAQTIILARLLAPEDFGLMAMTLAVVGLGQMFSDLGFSNAVIHRQDASRDQLSALYWLNIAAGAVIFTIIVLASPLAAMAFGEPRMREPLMLAAAVFLIAPLGQQFQALLQKHLRFRPLALVEVAAASAGAAVAVTMAMQDQGVIALVLGFLTQTAVKALLLVRLGWRDWRPSFRLRRVDLAGFVSFGLYQMGARTVIYVRTSWDQILVGAVLGAQALGFYQLAHLLVMQPVMRLNPIVTRVALPMFARVQHDISTLLSWYLFMLRALASVNFPLLSGLAVTAPWLVPILFGEKWIPAIPLVQFLAAIGLFRSIGNPAGTFLLARGRADLAFKWNSAVAAFYLPVLALGIQFAGMNGLVWSLLAVQALATTGAYRFLVRTQLGPCLGRYLGSLVPAFFLSALMAAGVQALMLVAGEPSAAKLAFFIGTGGVIYVGLYYLLQREQFVTFRDLFFGANRQARGM